MAAEKAILVIGAQLANGTKSAFKSVSDGFKAISDSMKVQAQALRELGKSYQAQQIEKFAEALDKQNSKLAVSGKKLNSLVTDYKKAASEIGSETSSVARSVDILDKAVNRVGVDFSKLSRIQVGTKGIKDAETAVKEVAKSLSGSVPVIQERWKQLSRLVSTDILSFEKATADIKKFGLSLHELMQVMAQTGRMSPKSIQEWANGLKLTSDVIKLVEKGVNRLSEAELRSLGISQQTASAITKITDKQRLWAKELERVKSIQSDTINSAENYAKALTTLAKKTQYSDEKFGVYAKTLRDIQAALSRMSIAQSGNKAFISWAKSIDRAAVALAALDTKYQHLIVTSTGFKANSMEGLKILGLESVEAAKKVGVLGKSFESLDKELSVLQAKYKLSDQALKAISDQAISATKSFKDAAIWVKNFNKELSNDVGLRKLLSTYSELISSNSTLADKAHKAIQAFIDGEITFKQLSSAMKEYNSVLEKTKTDIEVLSIKYRDLLSSQSVFADKAKAQLFILSQQPEKIRQVREELARLNKTYNVLDRAKNKFEALLAANNRYGNAARILLNIVEQEGRGVDNLLSRLSRLDVAYKKAAGSIGVMRTAVDRLTRSFTTLASYWTAFAALNALTKSFGFAKQSVIEFDQALADLQAITKATDSETAMMGETIKAVAESTRFTTSQVAEGMRILGQAGLSASEVIQVIGPVADLATGALTSLSTAADLVTTTLRVFNVEVGNSESIANTFANAVNDSKLTIDKLKTALNYVGPVAASAGVTFKELSATMMVLADSGIRASSIGTGLRRMFAELVSPSKKFKQAIDDAGLTLEDLSLKYNKTEDVLDNLSIVLQNTGVAFDVFGKRGAAAVLALTENTGKFKEFVSGIGKASAAANMAQTQMEGLSASIEQLKDKLSVLAVDFSERNGITYIFKGLLEVVKKLADTLIWFVNTPLGNLITSFATAVAAVVAFNVILKVGKALIIQWAESMGIATVASEAFTLSLGPVGWAIVAVTTVLAGYAMFANKAATSTKNFNEELSSVDSIDKAISSYKKLDKSLNSVYDTAKTLKKSLYDAAKNGPEELAEKATKAANSIDGLTGELLDGGRALEEYQSSLRKFSVDAWAKKATKAFEELDSSARGTMDIWDRVGLAIQGGTKSLEEWRSYIANLDPNDVGKDTIKELTAKLAEAESTVNGLINKWREMGILDLSMPDSALVALANKANLSEISIKNLLIRFNELKASASSSDILTKWQKEFEEGKRTLSSFIDEYERLGGTVKSVEADNVRSYDEARRALVNQKRAAKERAESEIKAGRDAAAAWADYAKEVVRLQNEASKVIRKGQENELLYRLRLFKTEQENHARKEQNITANYRRASEERAMLIAKEADRNTKALQEIFNKPINMSSQIKAFSDLADKTESIQRDLAFKLENIERTRAERVFDINKRLGERLAEISKEVLDSKRKYSADIIGIEESIADRIRAIQERNASVYEKDALEREAAERKYAKAMKLIQEAEASGDKEKLARGKALIEQYATIVEKYRDEQEAINELKKAEVQLKKVRRIEYQMEKHDIYLKKLKTEKTALYDIDKANNDAARSSEKAVHTAEKAIDSAVESIIRAYEQANKSWSLRHQQVIDDLYAEAEVAKETIGSIATESMPEVVIEFKGSVNPVGPLPDMVNYIKDLINTISDDIADVTIHIVLDGYSSVMSSLSDVKSMLDSIVDKTITLSVKVLGAENVVRLIGLLSQLRDRTINVTTVYRTIHLREAGGIIPDVVQGFSTGNFVKLLSPYITKGSGNKDDVPALLTKGEYVINAETVKKLGKSFFDALNFGVGFSDKIANMIHSIPKFSSGGYTASSVSPGVGNTDVIAIELTTSEGKASAPLITTRDTAEALIYELKKAKRLKT